MSHESGNCGCNVERSCANRATQEIGAIELSTLRRRTRSGSRRRAVRCWSCPTLHPKELLKPKASIKLERRLLGRRTARRHAISCSSPARITCKPWTPHTRALDRACSRLAQVCQRMQCGACCCCCKPQNLATVSRRDLKSEGPLRNPESAPFAVPMLERYYQ